MTTRKPAARNGRKNGNGNGNGKPPAPAADAPVPAAAVPAHAFEDVGMGNENLDRDDVIIPRIQVAQALSPQIKEGKPEYIPGCRDGSIFNSVTMEVYEPPLMVVPVFYKRRYVEWRPRMAGGGLVNPEHSDTIMEQTTNEEGRNILPNGNEIVVTPEHYVLVVGSGGETAGYAERAVLTMAGTKAKVSRQWNSLISGLRITHPETGEAKNPARFYGVYNFETVAVSNDKGDFYNLRVSYLGPVFDLPGGELIYREAKSFFALAREGRVKADDSDAAGNSTSGQAQGQGQSSAGLDDDIPF